MLGGGNYLRLRSRRLTGSPGARAGLGAGAMLKGNLARGTYVFELLWRARSGPAAGRPPRRIVGGGSAASSWNYAPAGYADSWIGDAGGGAVCGRAGTADDGHLRRTAHGPRPRHVGEGDTGPSSRRPRLLRRVARDGDRVGESAPAHDVVAAVLVDVGRVLLCHRRADLRWYPNVWDLPGGHVEPGESAAEALRRECREELGVDVVEERRVARVREDDLHLSVFVVSRWDGRPRTPRPRSTTSCAGSRPASWTDSRWPTLGTHRCSATPCECHRSTRCGVFPVTDAQSREGTTCRSPTPPWNRGGSRSWTSSDHGCSVSPTASWAL